MHQGWGRLEASNGNSSDRRWSHRGRRNSTSRNCKHVVGLFLFHNWHLRFCLFLLLQLLLLLLKLLLHLLLKQLLLLLLLPLPVLLLLLLLK